jgi:hypothetical protein
LLDLACRNDVSEHLMGRWLSVVEEVATKIPGYGQAKPADDEA